MSTADSRTTRKDWVQTAFDTLLSDGVENVKVLSIANKLNCARSSFYWFFKSRQELLDALLAIWRESNTQAIVARTQKPADTVSQAALNVFECWADDRIFDVRLDFAVREWARRSGPVRRQVDLADDARVDALRQMFQRFGFAREEAFIRARTLYFMQIGYYALDVTETLDDRLSHLATYIYCFTGEKPRKADLDRFRAFARAGDAG